MRNCMSVTSVDMVYLLWNTHTYSPHLKALFTQITCESTYTCIKDMQVRVHTSTRIFSLQLHVHVHVLVILWWSTCRSFSHELTPSKVNVKKTVRTHTTYKCIQVYTQAKFCNILVVAILCSQVKGGPLVIVGGLYHFLELRINLYADGSTLLITLLLWEKEETWVNCGVCINKHVCVCVVNTLNTRAKCAHCFTTSVYKYTLKCLLKCSFQTYASRLMKF